MAGETTFGIRIKADASGFKGQVGEAKQAVEGFGKEADNASVALASRFGVAVGAAAVAVGTTFVLQVRNAINALDDLDETAQGLGLAAETLSSMQISAQAAGVGSDMLTRSLQRLNAQIADAASGNTRAVALFKSMGVEVRTSAGVLKTADQILGDISERFRGYADDAAKANLAQELFGRGSTKMITYMAEGREGLTKFAGASREQIAEAAKLAAEIDKLSASWDRLKLSIGGTVAGGINSALAAVGSESENAADKVLQRLEASMVGMRRELAGRMNAEMRAALQQELADAERRAEDLRRTVARAQREAIYGNTGYGEGRPSAPNPGGTPAAGGGGRSGLTDEQREAIRLEKELQQIRAAGYQQAIRDQEARARELAGLEAQNEAIRQQIEEFGKTEVEVANLRAARLDDAAATKEQRLAQLELVDGNEAEIVQLREQIRLLRERAQLTRAAGGQAGLDRQQREGMDAARQAAREAADANREMTSELRRGLTDALMRGFEGGKGAARNFFDSLGNMIQTMLLEKLASGLINTFMNELGGGAGSSGGLDFIGDWFIGAFGMHSGGVVGADATFTRTVPASTFAGARRYHRGGMVLGPDEVPIIAQRGETVLPAGTGMGGVTVNVINNAGAQVRTQQREEGGGLTMDVIIEAVDNALAGNVNRGQGALAGAFAGRFGLRAMPR